MEPEVPIGNRNISCLWQILPSTRSTTIFSSPISPPQVGPDLGYVDVDTLGSPRAKQQQAELPITNVRADAHAAPTSPPSLDSDHPSKATAGHSKVPTSGHHHPSKEDVVPSKDVQIDLPGDAAGDAAGGAAGDAPALPRSCWNLRRSCYVQDKQRAEVIRARITWEERVQLPPLQVGMLCLLILSVVVTNITGGPRG